MSTKCGNIILLLCMSVILIGFCVAQDNEDTSYCSNSNIICATNANCTNSSCTCNPGYTGNGTFCEDFDECLNNTTCPNLANCTNSQGSYNCTCPQGYYLVNNTCQDFDECLNNTTCPDHANCTNTPGSYNCTCPQGYYLVNNTCQDINECLKNTTCPNLANCTNSPGSYNCTCLQGYSLINNTCQDINECLKNTTCPNLANCTNTQGSYNCICPQGYYLVNNTCQDVDECASNPAICSTNANCTNTEGGYNCNCYAGYTGDGTTCKGVVECSKNISECPEHVNCTGINGSFICTCQDGYMRNETICEDVDECLKVNACPEHANCKNTNGGFNCTCRSGYTLNDSVCQDVDECLKDSTCPDLANCTNTPGSYICTCPQGYSLTNNTCQDINECLNNTTCPDHANCTNTPGSYNCACLQGYFLTNKTCQDIDECLNNTTCPDHAKCTNTPGSYNCACLQGYYLINNTCHDIDECLNNTTCPNLANCTNSQGSYNCTCPQGYFFINNTCQDIDECLKNTTCPNLANCTNTPGSYKCTCLQGYSLINNTCQDKDECLTESHSCHKRANCTNTVGGYNCTCINGFDGDGRTCTDINECNVETICNGSYCHNYQGGYKCLCISGWTGDNCTEDVKECKEKNGGCHSNATCVETPGSYTCTCHEGFRGNGTYCIRKILVDDSMYSSQPVPDDQLIKTFTVSSGFPFQGKMYYKIFVSRRGMVSLGKEVTASYPPARPDLWNQYSSAIVAPFWSNLDTSPNGLTVAEITNTTLLENIQKINETHLVNIRYCLIVTWHGAKPFPYQENGNEMVDFQVLLMTNYTTSFAMFNYDLERFTWLTTRGHIVRIGFSKSDSTGNVLFDDNFADVNRNTNTDLTGRWLYNLSEYNASFEAAFKCSSSLSDETFLKQLNDILANSDPCPCSLQQAQLDLRYVQTTVDRYNVFQSRFTQPPNNTKQECHYDSYGSLVMGFPGGGYVTGSDTVNTIYSQCCNQSDLCQKFYAIVKSDNCSRYKPPVWAFSFGDPRFSTVDHETFSFNGRGEYVYLQSDKNNVTVQIRTELVSRNNTTNVDGAMIVGLAAKVNNLQIELKWNDTLSKWENNTSNEYWIQNENQGFFFSKVINIKIEIGAVSLNIVPQLSSDFSDCKGLLGNTTRNNSKGFLFRNDTSIPLNSSESEIFEFGQSWMLESSTSSLFTYDEEYNFTYYNNIIVKPENFLGDLNDTQLKGYIQENCNDSTINLTFCGTNRDCKVDTAVTCNETFGYLTKRFQEKIKQEQSELNNSPPVVPANMVLHVYNDLNKTITLNMSELITDKDGTFITKIQTNIDNGSYSFDGTLFMWNVSETLRNESVFIKFTAVDNLNASRLFWPSIVYCGCGDHKHCQDEGPYIDGNNKYSRLSCACPSDSRGTFCETVDACFSHPCASNVTCNSTNHSTSPCGNCPKGMQGNGTVCFHLNPCEPGACGQHARCIETEPGMKRCDCEGNGTFTYTNDSNLACEDVDECANLFKKPCDKSNTVCQNTIGGYDCPCISGYANVSGTCKKAEYSVVIQLVFTIPENPKMDVKTIAHKIMTEIFKNSSDVTFDITDIKLHATRQRRNVNNPTMTYDITVVAHSTSTNSSSMNATFSTFLDAGINGHRDIEDLYVSILTNESRIYPDEHSPLCNIPGATVCDLISTDCNVTNGRVTCFCKPGFLGWQNPYTSCKDIDECGSNRTVCLNGNCINTPGSYRCNCETGFTYNGHSCVDACVPNPCQNGGKCVHDTTTVFKCTCVDRWAGPLCDREHAEVSKLRTVAIVVGACAGAIILLLLLSCLGIWRRSKARKLRSLRGFEDDMSLMRTPADTKDTTIPDDAATTFSIPRAKLSQIDLNAGERDQTENAGDRGKGDDATSLAESSEGRYSIPRPHYSGLYSQSSKRNIDGKGDIQLETLARAQPDYESGADNPSFLHSPKRLSERTSVDKISKNPYEYF